MAYRNVKTEIKGDLLTISVDVSKAAIADAEPSKSGKTKIVGTTGGFTRIGNVSLSLNVTAD